MVVIKKQLNRSAFTMIELIFAIVIISIAVMSLPVMTRITSKGIESNILQEAIFAASAELMGASAGYWDENSMSDHALSHLSRVIDVGSTCNTDRLRPGHIAQPLHRRCIDADIATVSLSNTADATFPNLDNAVHASQVVFLNANPEAAGYKESYKSVVTIQRVDEAGNADNNIKKLTVLITNNAADKDITRLFMYSANVGEIDYYKERL